jgi:cytochrome c553
MRIGWRHLVGLAVLVGAGGFLLAWSGLVSVAASSGHGPVVGWFLHFTLRQAVDTQSLGITPPAMLDHPGQVALGAAHFAGNCAPCHGGPGTPQSPLVLAMTPPPPPLAPTIPTWEPRHLFWIVQHGIKYSGMPAWATQVRPDEVWPVIAFLVRLPKLDETSYRRLSFLTEAAVDDDAEPAIPMLAGCAACHGRDGTGLDSPLVPRLGGQNQAYLAASLRAYASGRRASGMMQSLAGSLSETAIVALSSHYAAQPWTKDKQPPVAPEQLAQGEHIARVGIPERGIPPCSSCHGPPAHYPHFPELAGQKTRYLARQLELFRDGTRGGASFAHLMPGFARRLSDADIQAVAAFYAQLPPTRKRAMRPDSN